MGGYNRLSVINFLSTVLCTDWPPISCPEQHQSNIRMWGVDPAQQYEQVERAGVEYEDVNKLQGQSDKRSQSRDYVVTQCAAYGQVRGN